MRIHLSFCSLLLQSVVAKVTTIPNIITQGAINLQWNDGLNLIDGQKILPRPNATSYEWYVSSNLPNQWSLAI